MRAQLVVNANARRGGRLGRRVARALLAHGITPFDDAGDAHAIDAIVVAGGDGTLVPVIARALALDVPVGIVPLGTFNELARTLGIPLDIGGACATIAAAHQRRIDVARVNGVYYANEASIGISSRAARSQLPEQKRRFGAFAVAAAALRALVHARSFDATIAYDGHRECLRTVQLTVANSHRFGGFLNVAGAAIDDGWLDLYGVEIGNAVEALSVARALFSGDRRPVPGLHAYRASAFSVITRRPHRVTADGEPAGETPAFFEVVPKALRVFVPE